MLQSLRHQLSRAMPVLLVAPLFAGTAWGGDLKAGFGRRNITPPIPILMAGFENRTQPADSVGNEIWSKALAFEDATGQKVVMVMVDLATMPQSMFDMAATRIMYRHGLDRAHVLINISHTHSGPLVDGWPAHTDREMMLRIEAYRNQVIDSMTESAMAAVADLQPADI